MDNIDPRIIYIVKIWRTYSSGVPIEDKSIFSHKFYSINIYSTKLNKSKFPKVVYILISEYVLQNVSVENFW